MHLYSIIHRGARVTDQWADTPWEAMALAGLSYHDVLCIEMLC